MRAHWSRRFFFPSTSPPPFPLPAFVFSKWTNVIDFSNIFIVRSGSASRQRSIRASYARIYRYNIIPSTFYDDDDREIVRRIISIDRKFARQGRRTYIYIYTIEFQTIYTPVNTGKS